MTTPPPVPIRDGKLIYHLTAITNMESILKNGLMPRNQIDEFTDVAEPRIITFRSENNLNDYVPFHFFKGTPFDGSVQKDHPSTDFVYICLLRDYAKRQGFKILTAHPMSLTNLELYDYSDGFDLIDWSTMEKKDYTDDYNKSVCMAECIAPRPIMLNDMYCIFVKTESNKQYLLKILSNIPFRTSIKIFVNPNMFVTT